MAGSCCEYEILTLILAEKQASLWGEALTPIHSWCSVLSHNWWNDKYWTQKLFHDTNSNPVMNWVT